jgi:hypothetical protein
VSEPIKPKITAFYEQQVITGTVHRAVQQFVGNPNVPEERTESIFKAFMDTDNNGTPDTLMRVPREQIPEKTPFLSDMKAVQKYIFKNNNSLPPNLDL